MTTRETIVYLLALCLLSACFPITCAQPVSADHDERDPATGKPIVTVRCGDLQVARDVCADGGAKRKTPTGWDILCDGSLLTHVDLTNPATEVGK